MQAVLGLLAKTHPQRLDLKEPGGLGTSLIRTLGQDWPRCRTLPPDLSTPWVNPHPHPCPHRLARQKPMMEPLVLSLELVQLTQPCWHPPGENGSLEVPLPVPTLCFPHYWKHSGPLASHFPFPLALVFIIFRSTLPSLTIAPPWLHP